MIVCYKQREHFINYLKSMILMIPVSTWSLVQFIRAIHISLPFNIFVILLFAPKWIVIINTIILFIIYTLFITLGGCFLTMLEQKLCKDDFVLTDPILEILQYDINKKNRYWITYFVGTIYILVYISIIYIRFFIL